MNSLGSCHQGEPAAGAQEDRGETGPDRDTLAAPAVVNLETVSGSELGTYLRTRREAVTPAMVGLPEGPRRRTPGLRRAELATLAGISVEYLTRLEQGRDRNPSLEVIGALAGALQLSSDERLHLKLLAGGGAGPCVSPQPPSQSVRSTTLQLLGQLEPAPAVVVNRLGDVLAFSTGYERVVGPIGVLDTDPPNVLRFVFADPRAKLAYPDWDRIADEQVARLRLGPTCADPHIRELAQELSDAAGTSFTGRLEGAAELPARTGVELLTHPEVGELRLSFEVLDVTTSGDQQLIVYLPADEATTTALDRLAGRQPGALRAVND